MIASVEAYVLFWTAEQILTGAGNANSTKGYLTKGANRTTEIGKIITRLAHPWGRWPQQPILG